MQSLRIRTIELLTALVAVCLVSSHCVCKADDNSLIESIARRLTHSRYMLPKPGDTGSSAPHCVKLEAGNPLLSEPVIKPYADRLALMPPAASDGVAIMECNYVSQDAHLPAYVIMLDIPPLRIAAWIVTACKNVEPHGVDGCADDLSNAIVKDNGGQYPISGFVSEGSAGDDLCLQNNVSQRREGLIGFRHGVTVQFRKTIDSSDRMLYCLTDPNSADVRTNQKNIALHYPVTQVYYVGRVADYDNGDKSRGEAEKKYADVPDGVEPNSWQKIVMNNIFKAIESGRDGLMERKAANQ